jgi:hypothetical protein
MVTATTRLLTLGQLATQLRCQLWQIQRLFDRGLLPPARRVGRMRVVDEADIDAVRQALVRAGYTR